MIPATLDFEVWAGFAPNQTFEARSKMFELHYGDIVEDWVHGSRGVVVLAKPEPGTKLWNMGPMYSNDYAIKVGHGSHSVTNNLDGHWRRVPEEARTAVERVESAMRRWQPADWRDEGDEPQECDSFEWFVLSRMIPEAVREELLEWDWPTTEELMIHVAQLIDDRTVGGNNVKAWIDWSIEMAIERKASERIRSMRIALDSAERKHDWELKRRDERYHVDIAHAEEAWRIRHAIENTPTSVDELLALDFYR